MYSPLVGGACHVSFRFFLSIEFLWVAAVWKNIILFKKTRLKDLNLNTVEQKNNFFNSRILTLQNFQAPNLLQMFQINVNQIWIRIVFQRHCHTEYLVQYRDALYIPDVNSDIFNYPKFFFTVFHLCVLGVYFRLQIFLHGFIANFRTIILEYSQCSKRAPNHTLKLHANLINYFESLVRTWVMKKLIQSV